jgi:hypothetical protein
VAQQAGRYHTLFSTRMGVDSLVRDVLRLEACNTLHALLLACEAVRCYCRLSTKDPLAVEQAVDPLCNAATMAQATPSTSLSATSVEAFGALTTPFTWPSYCSTVFVRYNATNNAMDRAQLGMTCGPDGVVTEATECLPSGKQPLYDYYSSGVTEIVYSPGISCPGGWTTAGIEEDTAGIVKTKCCPS